MAQTLSLGPYGISSSPARAVSALFGMSFDEGLPTDWALEYDVYMVPSAIAGASGVTLFNFHELSDGSGGVDQFGISDGDSSRLIALVNGRWLKRVIRLTNTTAFVRLGVRYAGPAGVGVPPLYFANVRVTYARQTKLWFWREGMALPAIGASSGLSTTPVFSFTTNTSGALPDYCCAADNAGLDDIRQDRSVGGRLSASMYWDRRREGFQLANIVVTADQRNEMEAIYDVFRRESFLYSHRSGYPPSRVRFERPPKFTDLTTISGAGKFSMQLALVEV